MEVSARAQDVEHHGCKASLHGVSYLFLAIFSFPSFSFLLFVYLFLIFIFLIFFYCLFDKGKKFREETRIHHDGGLVQSETTRFYRQQRLSTDSYIW